MNLLAFDLGGSGGQLFLGAYDGDRLRLESVARIRNGPIALGDGLYWDAIGIYRDLLEGVEKACAATDVASFGMDAFCNDFALVGGEGELLTPVRCYRDERTVRHARYVYDRADPALLYRLTGNQTARFNTLMQLGAMQAAGLGYLTRGASHFLFLPDLFGYFLTGEMATEYTLASVSQMFSAAEGDWVDALLAIGGIRRDQLAPLRMPGSVLGKVRAGVLSAQGAGRIRVVSVCAHDTASAYLASPFAGDGQAILSSGTWALLGCTLDAPIITDAGFRYNLANEGGYPGYQRLLRNVMGLWLLQQLREDYRVHGRAVSYPEIEAAAEKSPPFAFFVDVDDDAFFSPGNMVGKLRAYCLRHQGRAPETLGEQARCLYEGLAFKYRFTLERLTEVTGKPFPFISILGGGCRDALMCRMTAGACGRPVAVGPEDATALGNLMAQLISAGEVASVAEGRELIARSFPPVWREPERGTEWDEAYEAYRAHLARGELRS